MRPKFDLPTLNAFVDRELDALSQREIEQRMQRDEGLRGEVAALRELREKVRYQAHYHVAPDEFRRRMASMVPALPSRLSLGKDRWQHWFDWRPMLVSIVALTLGLLLPNLTAWRPRHDERLEQEVVASHVRSTLSQHLVDVASSDHHTVKPWLAAKLDFSPAVPELQEMNMPSLLFLGGRIDYLDGRPVAALVYRQGAHVVNSFLWPTPAADSEPTFSIDRGYQIARWSSGGMIHWVISDVNPQEFRAVVHAFTAARIHGS